jgi:hypothetical protein
MLKNPVKVKKRIDLLQKHALKRLPEISQTTGLSVNQLQRAMRVAKVRFTEIQKEKRIQFISENQHLTNKGLETKLDISMVIVSTLIKEAKKRGLITGTRIRAKRNAALPLEYHWSALSLARLLKWVPGKKGITRKASLQILGIKSRGLSKTVNVLESKGFIFKKRVQGFKIVRTKGQKPVKKTTTNVAFELTQEGKQWFNQMEVRRVEKDVELLKNPAGAKSVLNRKESELTSLENLTRFIQSEGLVLEGAMQRLLRVKQTEIERLRFQVYGKK